MKSMTGYGTHTERSKEFEVQVTLRSVNGRFLEVKPHLPRAYQSLESKIKGSVKDVYRRGTVDLYVQRRALNSVPGEVVFNEGAAKQWLKMHKSLAASLKLPFEMSLKDMASLPEVFSVVDSQGISEAEKVVMLKALKGAVAQADKERVREGKALKAEISSQLKAISTSLKGIKGHAKTMKKKIADRLDTRLKSLLKEDDIDPQRQAQEVAILVDKADISEEITRLEEHLRRFRDLVGASTSVGKKMDFYCQELLREFNTIGSKSVYAELTAEVLNAKSGIESLREQVQNIE